MKMSALRKAKNAGKINAEAEMLIKEAAVKVFENFEEILIGMLNEINISKEAIMAIDEVSYKTFCNKFFSLEGAIDSNDVIVTQYAKVIMDGWRNE